MIEYQTCKRETHRFKAAHLQTNKKRFSAMDEEKSQAVQASVLERALRKNTMQMERLLAHQVWSALGDEKIITFPYQDVEVSFHLPDGWFDLLQRLILLNRTFYEVPLLENIRRRLRPSPVIVDAGANIGNHTVFFGKLCGASRIYSVEPMPYIRGILKENAKINNLTSVEILPCALGAVSGTIGVEIFNPANLGSTTLSVERPGSIPVRTLDSFSIPKLDLLKIDVEGMQDAVLIGATEVLRQHKPLIVVEAFKRNRERAKTVELLDSLGYKVDEVIGHNVIAVPR